MPNFNKIAHTLKWLPGYFLHSLSKSSNNPAHLIITVADHFEPCFTNSYGNFASVEVQVARVKDWAAKYVQSADRYRDSDGYPFKHTYFYPAEHYHGEVLEALSRHCREGWGEIEVHLHHGIERPASSQNTRTMLETFRDQLVSHGCLSHVEGSNTVNYGFVHGNWALANSNGGRFCGVDDELQILAETGCYADFTLPSAPDPAQIAKVNSIYECSLPLNRRSPHRRGNDLRVGNPPKQLPVIMQGPLVPHFKPGTLLPKIENGELTVKNPPTLQRLQLWQSAGIGIRNRPEWCFIKLHCHGMNPWDEPAMHGELKIGFLRDVSEVTKANGVQVHYASAREMFNIALAACDGKSGNPNAYRDYRLKMLP